MDKRQREFLEQAPSVEQYLKTADEFLKKLQLRIAEQAINLQYKQLEKKRQQEKINVVETILQERLRNRTCN